MIESNKKLIDNNQIYWALESQSKGKKLMHTDQELRNLDKFKMEFLQNQFVQIIDQDNLQDVLIYSLKSPDKCLSEGI